MTRSRRSLIAALSCALLAALCALACGAVWSMIAGWYGSFTWFAFVVAVVLAFVMRYSGARPRWYGCLLAAGGTALACLYAESLQLAIGLASQLGLPLDAVIATSGVGHLAQLSWAVLPDTRGLAYLAALVLAAILTAWLLRPARQVNGRPAHPV